mgnify:CR=1 FL=1
MANAPRWSDASGCTTAQRQPLVNAGGLVLDGPANGLDPRGIRWLREFLRWFAGRGNAVFVSSHLLSEMAQMAGRDVELFEALAGDLLSSLGYERAAPTTSPGTAEVARACLSRWDLEVRQRRRGPGFSGPGCRQAEGASA